MPDSEGRCFAKSLACVDWSNSLAFGGGDGITGLLITGSGLGGIRCSAANTVSRSLEDFADADNDNAAFDGCDPAAGSGLTCDWLAPLLFLLSLMLCAIFAVVECIAAAEGASVLAGGIDVRDDATLDGVLLVASVFIDRVLS